MLGALADERGAPQRFCLNAGVLLGRVLLPEAKIRHRPNFIPEKSPTNSGRLHLFIPSSSLGARGVARATGGMTKTTVGRVGLSDASLPC